MDKYSTDGGAVRAKEIKFGPTNTASEPPLVLALLLSLQCSRIFHCQEL